MPRQADLLDRLIVMVEDTEEHRSLVVSCSLGRGKGDAWSDIDAGVSHTILDEQDLEHHATHIAEGLGELVGIFVHLLDGFGQPTRRVAAEYVSGVQLDLVFMPTSGRSYHYAGEEIVLVDKDNTVSTPFTPPADELAKRTAERANEYAHFGWWMLSDVAKYLQRRSWYEAVERLGVARDFTLRLIAVGAEIPFPQYGLTSLVDFAPQAIPNALAGTYASPSDPAAIAQAALLLAELLAAATNQASSAVGHQLSIGWQEPARTRVLAAASTISGS